MFSIYLLDSSKLFQWDLNRKIKIIGQEEVDEVHFSHIGDEEALVVKPIKENNILIVNIPNILLQEHKNIFVYLVSKNKTLKGTFFTVGRREKPADYVYTETEIKNYDALEKRIKVLEENGGNGKPGADGFSPVASVEQTEDGAEITITDKNGTTKATVKNGKDGMNGAKGEKGDKGDTGEKGADGTSVEIKNIFESTIDGGNNVVIFSDGQKMIIKNGTKGSKGDDGYTPIKGKDYFDGQNGKDGADGANGTDGKSAYELAVEKGFSGSLVQWLNSLVGAAGADGKDGADGKTAYQYAQDGGYVGAEEDFADKLAQENPTKEKFEEEISKLSREKADKKDIPNVPTWAMSETKPKYTAEETMADKQGTAESKVSEHNILETSHNDIRLLISELSTRLNTIANSDDVTLDQMNELVAAIKSNKSLIESITTNKVNVSDIIDNLTTSVPNKPLSAKQGVQLKALIDSIFVPTLLSQLNEDSTHRTVTDTEKQIWNNKSDFSGLYDDLINKPTIPVKTSQLTDDVGYAKQSYVNNITESKLDKSKLTEAINQTLAQAKDSGEFDGQDGQNGKDGITPYIDEEGYIIYGSDEIIPVNVVKFDPQNLTESQKTQARENIGAVSLEDIQSIIDEENIAFTWKGEWVENGQDGKGYTPNDVVSYEGNLYISLTNNTYENPIKHTLNWELFLKGGEVTAENINTALGYQPADKKIVDELSREIADLGGVVDYVKTEAKEVADKAVEKRTINSLVLLMGSDIHVSNSDVVRTAIKHMGQGMNEICNHITLDGAVFLGDYNYQINTISKAQGIEDTKYFGECIADVRKAILTILMNGNHDYVAVSSSDTENRLSEDEVYALIGSNNSDKVVVDVDNLGRNYGYVDFAKQRIRLIYLNTTDCAEVGYSSHLISNAQGQWFESKALDLSDKEDEEKWGVVVCSHMPLFDNPQVPTVLGHFADRTSGRSFSQDYDFTNTKAELVGVFHGHLHNFKVTEKTTSNGNTIKYICIPNAVPNRENPYTDNADYNEVDENGNSVSYPKTTGTEEDTTFNVVIIDKDNKKIHAICYGAGYDREISYAQEEPEAEIINQIPISTDASGAIYNGKGFKEGTRLGSDGTDRSNASTDATGFIPAKLGDNVYLSNCQIVGDGTEYNEIAFYKSDKTFVRKIYTTASTITSGWDGVYDEANNLVQISLSALSAWGEGAEIAYIRITGNYIGADSIITVNQPIE